MSTKELHVVCNKCGKEAPIDQERSTVLGVAYDTSRPCKCGGEWEVQEKVNEIINKDNDEQELEVASIEENENIPVIDALSNMNSIVQALINSPAENLVSFIDIYLIANAKSELNRILKYMKLLDQVEEKYIDKVMRESDDYPITLMHDILGFITSSIDRSNAIITSIIKANPEIPQNVQFSVGDNSTITINNIKADNMNVHSGDGVSQLSSSQRERIRNYISSITKNMDTLETTIVEDNNGEE